MDDREVFVAVAEAGSFTAGAQQLGISTSYASRQVRALEQRLGVTLLARTTRQVLPTEVGARYLAEVGPLLRGLEEADAAAVHERVEPAGRLRVAAPLSFGLRHVQPVLTALACAHPRLRVEASFEDRRVDPLHFDVTIRGGALRDTGLRARRLCDLEAWILASPSYLAHHGTPTHPAELTEHRLLHYTRTSTLPAWRFVRGDDDVVVQAEPVYAADSGDALVAATLAGLGISQQPSFLCEAEVADGRLVRLLPDWDGFRSSFWALWPSRHPTAAVRVLVERLVERLQGP